MNSEPFGRRLAAAMDARGPLAVGIDPHPALLSAWGLDMTPPALERFAMTVIDALAARVAVLKPQSAFFEAFGAAGIAVLERVLTAGRDAGALMLVDAKRGDIGSTMAAYARAYLADDAPLAADALTVSPFLGFGSLQPAIDAALSSGRGLFVLCRTSNPEGASVQLARVPLGEASSMTPVAGRSAMTQKPHTRRATTSISAGRVSAEPDECGIFGAAPTISARVAAAAAELNAGAEPMGSIGLVVGATIAEVSADLAGANAPLLAPGIGAQGATAADLRAVFGDAARCVLPSVSRSVLGAGPDVSALRDAASRTVEEIRAALR